MSSFIFLMKKVWENWIKNELINSVVFRVGFIFQSWNLMPRKLLEFCEFAVFPRKKLSVSSPKMQQPHLLWGPVVQNTALNQNWWSLKLGHSDWHYNISQQIDDISGHCK